MDGSSRMLSNHNDVDSIDGSSPPPLLSLLRSDMASCASRSSLVGLARLGSLQNDHPVSIGDADCSSDKSDLGSSRTHPYLPDRTGDSFENADEDAALEKLESNALKFPKPDRFEGSQKTLYKQYVRNLLEFQKGADEKESKMYADILKNIQELQANMSDASSEDSLRSDDHDAILQQLETTVLPSPNLDSDNVFETSSSLSSSLSRHRSIVSQVAELVENAPQNSGQLVQGGLTHISESPSVGDDSVFDRQDLGFFEYVTGKQLDSEKANVDLNFRHAESLAHINVASSIKQYLRFTSASGFCGPEPLDSAGAHEMHLHARIEDLDWASFDAEKSITHQYLACREHQAVPLFSASIPFLLLSSVHINAKKGCKMLMNHQVGPKIIDRIVANFAAMVHGDLSLLSQDDIPKEFLSKDTISIIEGIRDVMNDPLVRQDALNRNFEIVSVGGNWEVEFLRLICDFFIMCVFPGARQFSCGEECATCWHAHIGSASITSILFRFALARAPAQVSKCFEGDGNSRSKYIWLIGRLRKKFMQGYASGGPFVSDVRDIELLGVPEPGSNCVANSLEVFCDVLAFCRNDPEFPNIPPQQAAEASSCRPVILRTPFGHEILMAMQDQIPMDKMLLKWIEIWSKWSDVSEQDLSVLLKEIITICNVCCYLWPPLVRGEIADSNVSLMCSPAIFFSALHAGIYICAMHSSVGTDGSIHEHGADKSFPICSLLELGAFGVSIVEDKTISACFQSLVSCQQKSLEDSDTPPWPALPIVDIKALNVAHHSSRDKSASQYGLYLHVLRPQLVSHLGVKFLFEGSDIPNMLDSPSKQEILQAMLCGMGCKERQNVVQRWIIPALKVLDIDDNMEDGLMSQYPSRNEKIQADSHFIKAWAKQVMLGPVVMPIFVTQVLRVHNNVEIKHNDSGDMLEFQNIHMGFHVENLTARRHAFVNIVSSVIQLVSQCRGVWLWDVLRAAMFLDKYTCKVFHVFAMFHFDYVYKAHMGKVVVSLAQAQSLLLRAVASGDDCIRTFSLISRILDNIHRCHDCTDPANQSAWIGQLSQAWKQQISPLTIAGMPDPVIATALICFFLHNPINSPAKITRNSSRDPIWQDPNVLLMARMYTASDAVLQFLSANPSSVACSRTTATLLHLCGMDGLLSERGAMDYLKPTQPLVRGPFLSEGTLIDMCKAGHAGALAMLSLKFPLLLVPKSKQQNLTTPLDCCELDIDKQVKIIGQVIKTSSSMACIWILCQAWPSAAYKFVQSKNGKFLLSKGTHVFLQPLLKPGSKNGKDAKKAFAKAPLHDRLSCEVQSAINEMLHACSCRYNCSYKWVPEYMLPYFLRAKKDMANILLQSSLSSLPSVEQFNKPSISTDQPSTLITNNLVDDRSKMYLFYSDVGGTSTENEVSITGAIQNGYFGGDEDFSAFEINPRSFLFYQATPEANKVQLSCHLRFWTPPNIPEYAGYYGKWSLEEDGEHVWSCKNMVPALTNDLNKIKCWFSPLPANRMDSPSFVSKVVAFLCCTLFSDGHYCVQEAIHLYDCLSNLPAQYSRDDGFDTSIVHPYTWLSVPLRLAVICSNAPPSLSVSTQKLQNDAWKSISWLLSHNISDNSSIETRNSHSRNMIQLGAAFFDVNAMLIWMQQHSSEMASISKCLDWFCTLSRCCEVLNNAFDTHACNMHASIARFLGASFITSSNPGDSSYALPSTSWQLPFFMFFKGKMHRELDNNMVEMGEDFTSFRSILTVSLKKTSAAIIKNLSLKRGVASTSPVTDLVSWCAALLFHFAAGESINVKGMEVLGKWVLLGEGGNSDRGRRSRMLAEEISVILESESARLKWNFLKNKLVNLNKSPASFDLGNDYAGFVAALSSAIARRDGLKDESSWNWEQLPHTGGHVLSTRAASSSTLDLDHKLRAMQVSALEMDVAYVQGCSAAKLNAQNLKEFAQFDLEAWTSEIEYGWLKLTGNIFCGLPPPTDMISLPPWKRSVDTHNAVLSRIEAELNARGGLDIDLSNFFKQAEDGTGPDLAKLSVVQWLGFIQKHKRISLQHGVLDINSFVQLLSVVRGLILPFRAEISGHMSSVQSNSSILQLEQFAAQCGLHKFTVSDDRGNKTIAFRIPWHRTLLASKIAMFSVHADGCGKNPWSVMSASAGCISLDEVRIVGYALIVDGIINTAFEGYFELLLRTRRAAQLGYVMVLNDAMNHVRNMPDSVVGRGVWRCFRSRICRLDEILSKIRGHCVNILTVEASAPHQIINTRQHLELSVVRGALLTNVGDGFMTTGTNFSVYDANLQFLREMAVAMKEMPAWLVRTRPRIVFQCLEAFQRFRSLTESKVEGAAGEHESDCSSSPASLHTYDDLLGEIGRTILANSALPRCFCEPLLVYLLSQDSALHCQVSKTQSWGQALTAIQFVSSLYLRAASLQALRSNMLEAIARSEFDIKSRMGYPIVLDTLDTLDQLTYIAIASVSRPQDVAAVAYNMLEILPNSLFASRTEEFVGNGLAVFRGLCKSTFEKNSCMGLLAILDWWLSWDKPSVGKIPDELIMARLLQMIMQMLLCASLQGRQSMEVSQEGACGLQCAVSKFFCELCLFVQARGNLTSATTTISPALKSAGDLLEDADSHLDQPFELFCSLAQVAEYVVPSYGHWGSMPISLCHILVPGKLGICHNALDWTISPEIYRALQFDSQQACFFTPDRGSESEHKAGSSSHLDQWKRRFVTLRKVAIAKRCIDNQIFDCISLNSSCKIRIPQHVINALNQQANGHAELYGNASSQVTSAVIVLQSKCRRFLLQESNAPLHLWRTVSANCHLLEQVLCSALDNLKVLGEERAQEAKLYNEMLGANMALEVPLWNDNVALAIQGQPSHPKFPDCLLRDLLPHGSVVERVAITAVVKFRCYIPGPNIPTLCWVLHQAFSIHQAINVVWKWLSEEDYPSASHCIQ